ncbi:MMPL family transporter [Conexibacter sp. W3-3-2]|uniref:MMPL family transporter n=1 Tax=Conexibacter sp. W3-3-2 TaxID=2675227 RepID=UPI0012B91EBA|nr:MMPL family transporter [Conexibacter sp. W3-3-2]MTD45195.1 MMPL family transporter [Conexibacter sp. W3-3-2]
MGALSGLALRRPRLVLVVWLVLTAALAYNGTQLESHIAPTSIEVPGTRAQAAQDLADAEIGSRGQAPVLLQGPAPAVRAQTARLAARLRADPRNTVLSAFDKGAPPQLRPAGGAVVLVERPTDETFGPEVADAVQPVVDAVVRPPVRASVTGFSAIGSAISDASVEQAHEAEKLAVPILLLVLLLVFRSPLGAAIPAVLGGATVASALGVADLVARTRDITDVCTPIASMMGLALGVDYSLLMVSRFREARRDGASVDAAAATAAQTAGRTVVVAGATILVTMGVAILLAPGTFLQSAAVGAAAAAVVGVLSALTAVPAALVLVGGHLERLRFGRAPADGGGLWGGLAAGLLRRPVLTALPAVAVLGALAVPGVGLDAGPPDVRVLPPDAPVRTDAERVVRALGPGWSAPLEVIAVDRRATLDTPAGRRALGVLRAGLVDDRDVALVLGPRPVGRSTLLTVVPRSGPNDPATAGLYDRVRRAADRLHASTGADARVGGVAAQLTDYRRAFNARLPWLVAALSAVAFVALVLVLRALLLPLVAVLLNALVVAGSFGVLSLLSTGSDPLLGGAGFADALSLLALLSLIFGLSLDYQVFILTRLRENWLRSGDVGTAIRSAIVRTGPVIMGAAAIMSGVFLAFMTPDLQTIRQTGAGLVATVLLAASAVCLIALPAALRLAGPAAFWIPAWLDRLLPVVDLEGDGAAADPAAGVSAPRPTATGAADAAGRWSGQLLVGPEHEGPPGRADGTILPSALHHIFLELAADHGHGQAIDVETRITHRAPLRIDRDVHIEAWCSRHDGPWRTLEATVRDGPVTIAHAETTVYVLNGGAGHSSRDA